MPAFPIPIDSTIALLEISLDGGTTWRYFTCHQGWTVPLDSTTNKLDTSCGPIVTGGSVTANSTFTATVIENPDATEYTYKDLVTLFINKTVFQVRQRSPVIGSFAAGAAYNLRYGAIVQNLTLTDAINSPLAYSGTFNSVGTISTVG